MSPTRADPHRRPGHPPLPWLLTFAQAWGSALLELAVTALDLADPAGAESLKYEALRERYLPEITFRGRVEHRNSQYAQYAAACMCGCLQPDLLSDAGWWQTPPWQYTVFAVVIYTGQRLSGRRCQWRTLRDGSPLGAASRSPRDQLWSRQAPRGAIEGCHLAVWDRPA